MDLPAADRRALLTLLWPRAALAERGADVGRWLRQGFAFLPPGASNFALGLAQELGGPCGVLAAVQAELLRLLLFEEPRNSSLELQELLNECVGSEEQQVERLGEALASLLVQIARCEGLETVKIVVVKNPSLVEGGEEDVEGMEFEESEVAAEVEQVSSRWTQEFEVLSGPRGVVSFVMSALRTKTVEKVKEEMDDADATLTGQFGHCGQELLNLLLTGRATSNVFDGAVPMGDTGLMLRGVQQRVRVGYLTQLEALRYCQVGAFFKSPEAPVWVIGSASHFSVGFAMDPAVCRESPSERLFQHIQRVFKAFDPAESGFMQVSSLQQSLKQLGVASDVLTNDYWMARLLGKLEMAEGAGIILWDEYWKVVSVLLHTGDVELALSGNYASNTVPRQRPRSDSDVARELQAQFDAEQSGAPVVAARPQESEVSQTANPNEPLKFEWFYYNGLRLRGGGSESLQEPRLAKCYIELETSSEFIGSSVPLVDPGKSGGHGSPALEEILRTKWPGAKLTWDGGVVPSVD